MAAPPPVSDSTGRKVAAARLSVVSNLCLCLLKLVVGVLSHSVSVLSEAAHSGTDLVASLIAFFSVQISDRPADQEHPYGHGKVESLSSLAEAALIFVAAGYILYEAIDRLITKHSPPHVDAGIVVMAVSSVANTIISAYLHRIARETDSLALEADAAHLRTDVFTSIGVLVGLGLVRITSITAIDSIAAICVAFPILLVAWRLTRSALDLLMDRQLPEEEIELVRGILVSFPGILGHHKLRTRKSGSARHVDAHIQLDDEMSLLKAHELTERLEDEIRKNLSNVEITLHMEPFVAETIHQHEKHGGPAPDG